MGEAGTTGRARVFGLVAGVAVFAGMLALPAPASIPPAAWHAAASAAWMAVWWLTEAVPVAVTALLPLVLFPLLGVLPSRATAAAYAHPLIFLFLGGFLLALALERWDLHRRMALAVLRRTGTSPPRVVAGFMLATAALSMWISNTATTVMMLPIALSVLGDRVRRRDRFATALLLGVAYAASIGGMATLIGTPPNALLAAYLSEHEGIELGFARWMILGVPLAVVLLGIAWLLLVRVLFRSSMGPGAALEPPAGPAAPMSPAERRVAAVFVATAAAWILRPLLPSTGALGAIGDETIALTAGVLLFVLPSGEGAGGRLLSWRDTRRLPWGVLLLFGGGLSLAAAVDGSGLGTWVGGAMRGFGAWPIVATLAVLSALVMFLTELTSNTATTATFLPLVGAFAAATGDAPFPLAAATALAASCAFMMPVATPPNAIVFGSGTMTVSQMARAGVWVNLSAIVVIAAAVLLLGPLVAG